MDTVKVSWSGGKDSTAAALLHIRAGHKVHMVCFIPFLSDGIPAIRRDHYEHIMRCKERFEQLGACVHITHGKTYEYHTHRIKKCGVNAGHFMGTGLGFGFCLFRNYCKIRDGIKSVHVDFDYEDIGIAADEVKRQGQLDTEKRSILVDQNRTELDAYRLCDRERMLSPIYSRSGRDGCAFCPNARTEEFLLWLEDYPEAAPKLEQIELFCKSVTPYSTPYRGWQWFTDRMKYGFIQLSFT